MGSYEHTVRHVDSEYKSLVHKFVLVHSIFYLSKTNFACPKDRWTVLQLKVWITSDDQLF